MTKCREISLDGQWNFYLSSTQPREELIRRGDMVFSDTIQLPSTVSSAGKSPLTGERSAGYLVDPRAFQGYAVYERTIAFSPSEGRTLLLTLEKTRVSILYINGKRVGRRDSLCTPHVYDITDYTDIDTMRITLVIDNVTCPVPGGHMTSPDTQTNWLGIAGKITLSEQPRVHLEKLRIYPDPDRRSITLRGILSGGDHLQVSLSAEQTTRKWDGHTLEEGCTMTLLRDRTEVLTADSEHSFSLTLSLPEALPWEEHQPALGRLELSYDGFCQQIPFGLRRFLAKGTSLYINHTRIFLRGKHDGMLFPMTGVAPTDLDSWLRVMGTAKEYGINHYRFHTCCPPEGAFQAADMLGLYLEPELPFWGTVEEPVTPGQEYLIREGFRILDRFGNHPSFFGLSLGNELWGSQKLLDRILTDYKAYDDRPLYTQGSNNFQFVPVVLEHEDFFVGVRFSGERLFRGSYAMCDAPLGHIQTHAPESIYTYDEHIRPKAVKAAENSKGKGTMEIQYGTGVKTVELEDSGEVIPGVPVISHEIGQYFMFPDFAEIPKYTGVLQPTNMEIFRERLEAAGLAHLADRYFLSSGRFAADCYKQELETALRSEELSGFQLLDLQDFTGQGTALVGILNSFMESKGLLSPEGWREFCNDRVLLGCLPGFVFSSGQSIPLTVKLFTYTGSPEKDPRVQIMLRKKEDCAPLSEASIALQGIVQDGVYEIGHTELHLPALEQPCCLELTLTLKDDPAIQNHYTLWSYPEADPAKEEELYTAPELCRDWTEAVGRLATGERVLFMPRIPAPSNPPEKGKLPHYVAGTYCTDFWNYPMFRSISESVGRPEPVGTLGLLIDPTHPALAAFPSDYYSTPQWYDIVTDSPAAILDGTGITPILRTIDNCERNHSLSILWEAKAAGGSILVCTAPLDLRRESLPCRQLLRSLLGYIRSDRFQPAAELTPGQLADFFTGEPLP